MTPPRPRCQITSPAPPGLVHGTVSIQATASDAASGIASVVVSVDGVVAPSASPLAWDTVHLATSGQART